MPALLPRAVSLLALSALAQAQVPQQLPPSDLDVPTVENLSGELAGLPPADEANESMADESPPGDGGNETDVQGPRPPDGWNETTTVGSPPQEGWNATGAGGPPPADRPNTTTTTGPRPTAKPGAEVSELGARDLRVSSDESCAGAMHGIYRFDGMTEQNVPYFVRERMDDAALPDEDVWLHRFPCGGSPGGGGAADAWLFSRTPPWEMTAERCGGAAVLLTLPVTQSTDLALNRSATWIGTCAREPVSVDVFVEPMDPRRDDLVLFGLGCDFSLNGLYRVQPSNVTWERPVYYMDGGDHGGLFLVYRDDLGDACESLNNKWSIWRREDIVDVVEVNCNVRAVLERDHAPDALGHGPWVEHCDGRPLETRASVEPRTRTPGRSGCSEDFARFVSDVSCGERGGRHTCSFQCHRMLRVADAVCSDMDEVLTPRGPVGANASQAGSTGSDAATAAPQGPWEPARARDHLHDKREACAPLADCYRSLSGLFSWQLEHCWQELCDIESASPECRHRFEATLDACNGSGATIEIEGEMQDIQETLDSMTWCEDGMRQAGVELSGFACESGFGGYVNGWYSEEGHTMDGRPWYKKADEELFIYFDQQCSPDFYPAWIVSMVPPDTTRDLNLQHNDHTTGCHNLANIASDSMMARGLDVMQLPKGTFEWTFLWCEDHGVFHRQVTISERNPALGADSCVEIPSDLAERINAMPCDAFHQP